ncbi:hypothetical protein GDO81_024171 [Engystomops pustulosus]|uniref:Uncharacterized protein n=1 Tax=Engystomops pustulosus TaxID=76066 RepID=A0AAV6Z8F9_ENGPU|nr:hypothetical protein GDO81_024171 [Engystomops pustulosus]
MERCELERLTSLFGQFLRQKFDLQNEPVNSAPALPENNSQQSVLSSKLPMLPSEEPPNSPLSDESDPAHNFAPGKHKHFTVHEKKILIEKVSHLFAL